MQHNFRLKQRVNLVDELTVDLVIEGFVKYLEEEWKCVVYIDKEPDGRRYRIPVSQLRPIRNDVRASLRLIYGGLHVQNSQA